MNQLARVFTLGAAHGFGVRCPITAVEATAASGIQDALHARCCEPGLIRDVIGGPTMPATQLEHLLAQLGLGPVRGSMWSRAGILQTRVTLSEDPIAHLRTVLAPI